MIQLRFNIILYLEHCMIVFFLIPNRGGLGRRDTGNFPGGPLLKNNLLFLYILNTYSRRYNTIIMSLNINYKYIYFFYIITCKCKNSKLFTFGI